MMSTLGIATTLFPARQSVARIALRHCVSYATATGGECYAGRYENDEEVRGRRAEIDTRSAVRPELWKRREAARARYAASPELRKKISEAARARYISDPEVKKKRALNRERYRTDPEYRRRILETNRQCRLRQIAKDPEGLKKKQKREEKEKERQRSKERDTQHDNLKRDDEKHREQKRRLLDAWRQHKLTLDPQSIKTTPQHSREYFRWRRANDPEYYQKILEAQRQKYRNDSEWRERFLKSKAASSRQRYLTDPEFRKKSLDTNAAWIAKNGYKRKLDDPDKQRVLLRGRLVYDLSSGKKLTWRTHVPVLYTDKVRHECATCGRTDFKLWWERKTEPGVYECHRCYTADWSKALPLEYEGVIGKGKGGSRR